MQTKINYTDNKQYLQRRNQVSDVVRDKYFEMPEQSMFITMLNAVDKQIDKIKERDPDTVVGILMFSRDITCIGDGCQESVILTPEELKQMKSVQEYHAWCAKAFAPNVT